MECFSVSGLRKVYPYYFTFTTFTKGRWVGEKILEVFGREFRAHPVEEYVSGSNNPAETHHGTFCSLQERCILDGTLTVNYEQVDVDYRLRHNDLLANIVHRYQIQSLARYFSLSHPETSHPFQARDPGAVQAHRHRPSLRGPGRPGQALLAPG